MMAISSLTRIEQRTRSAAIDAARMNPRQRRVFELYYAMDEERSLEKLLIVCHEEFKIVVSLKTLARWSAEYGWQALIEEIDRRIVEKLAEKLMPLHEERIKLDMMAMQRMKLRFIERVNKDEVEVSLDDYLKILKAEDMIRRNPYGERTDDETGNVRMTLDVPREVFNNALALSVASKHGLPPPRLVEPKTIEHEEASDENTEPS